MLLDRWSGGIAGQFPNASRVPPVIIGRERRRACRVLHAWLRSVSLALQTLAEHLAMAADALGLLARPAFGRLLVGAPPLHLAERTLALHFLLEYPQRRIDVVVADKNLHGRP